MSFHLKNRYIMNHKEYIISLGFSPKENTEHVYTKRYSQHGEYCIDINLEKQELIYNEIISESKTTQNFSQPENFVILECVDRLLTKGYSPKNIILEKTWRSGHGTSGRLDIYVTRENKSPYMLIECKTYGKEFNKELSKTKKDGGQLFTYFQLSGHKADLIMLYTSELKDTNINYKNEIIKIEDNYRSGEVKDIYDKWSKLTKDNGVFDSWVAAPYNFESKALTKDQLKEISSDDASFIFIRFLEILRHSVVSDKGNAFNKIFTLFLCKVYDETTTNGNDELAFQWKEGIDNHVDFQLRLTDLYREGMKRFLDRIVSDFSKADFDNKYAGLSKETRDSLLEEITILRLEKNNEFAIKEVYDRQSFEENAKVVKEVVELLQGYRIRYNKRQQYLSDFFELLLTTGLKQESGQFFTPVPIAQFIIKSLPLDTIVAEKLKEKSGEILPYMIDYAAGSGHFITEYMHEVQCLINKCNHQNYIEGTSLQIQNWQTDHFNWATQYVYGIEKDYRLVKVGKVGCYLHGDGLANVILSDGLAHFTNKEYKGKLQKEQKDNSKDNQQFDVLLSNPPYSVSSFRQTTRDYYNEDDFELYSSLTDNSSEIECLFVERAKQLLKDGGVTGIILPSSILNNAGIYTKSRELILQYFEIISIVELGSNTFMATNTSTVVLFLRRRNNYDSKKLKISVDDFFTKFNDITLNGIEFPVQKYIEHVWGNITLNDYISLLQKKPIQNIEEHVIYQEYCKKIKVKNGKFWDIVLKTENEKLYYFILAYPQKIVLVKSGEKEAEKRFLGYEFSNRRGKEGIHPIQRGKNIEDCTKLFDADTYDNPDKASTYIYKAFNGDFDSSIAPSMQDNVTRASLVDLLTFDRVDFEKTILTSIKKKIKISTKWKLVKIRDLAESQYGYTDKAIDKGTIRYLRITDIDNDGTILDSIEKKFISPSKEVIKQYQLHDEDILIARSGSIGKSTIYSAEDNEPMIFASYLIRLLINKDKIIPRYLFYYTKTDYFKKQVGFYGISLSLPNLNAEKIKDFMIPLPPKDIQEKIVAELDAIEATNIISKKQIKESYSQIEQLFCELEQNHTEPYRLSNTDNFQLAIGKRVLAKDLTGEGNIPVYSANVFEPFGIINKLLIKDFSKPSILWGIDGDWMVNYLSDDTPFYPTDHCGILRVLNEKIHPRYIAWALHNEGKNIGFSRQLRASIDRIAGITINVPSSLAIQEQTISKVEALELEILKAQAIIDEAPTKKEEIIRKYL